MIEPAADPGALRVLPLVMEAVAQDEIALPPFAGSTVRGAFGHALKDVLCVVDHGVCDACALLADCAYPELFETRPRTGLALLGDVPRWPHPFALVPPEGPRRLAPGDAFTFGVTLLGRAVAWAAPVVEAVALAGERGLSATRGRFALNAVRSRGAVLAERRSAAGLVLADLRGAPFPVRDLERDLACDALAVTFDTPARLTWRGRPAAEVPFHVLARNLLRRAATLLAIHEGRELALDARVTVAAAERVVTDNAHLERVRRVRFSARQGRTMRVEGMRGRAVYRAPPGETFAPFAALLALGEAAGAGKGTTFGFGRMRAEPA